MPWPSVFRPLWHRPKLPFLIPSKAPGAASPVICDTGFELAHLAEFTTSAGTNTSFSTSYANGGTYSLRVNPGAGATGAVTLNGRDNRGALATWFPTALSQMYLRFDFLYITKPTTAQEIILEYGHSSIVRGNLSLTSTGTIQLRNGTGAGTLLATSATALAAGTWYTVELYLNGSTQDYELRINTLTEFSGNGINSATYEYVYLGKTTDHNSNAVDLYYDNAKIRSDTWPGYGRTVLVPITTESSHTEWTPSSGTWVTAVDDVPVNDDTDYVSSSVAGQAMNYIFENSLPGGFTNVLGLKLIAILRGEAASGNSVTLRVIHGVSSQYSKIFQNYAVGSSYRSLAASFEVDPITGLPWVVGDIQNFVIDVLNNTNTATRLTSVALMAEYLPVFAVTDSATLVDSPLVLLAPTDTVTAEDLVTAVTSVSLTTDAFTESEETSYIIFALSDGSTLAETVATSEQYIVNDAFTVNDTTDSSLTLIASEGISFTDTVSASAPSSEIAESLSSSDSGIVLHILTDTSSFSESLALLPVVTDTVTATDTLGQFITPDETFTAVETIVVTITLGSSDTVTSTDTLTSLAPIVVDSIIEVETSTVFVVVSDAHVVAENSLSITATLVITESFVFSEQGLIFPVGIADSLTFTDTHAVVPTVTEALSVSAETSSLFEVLQDQGSFQETQFILSYGYVDTGTVSEEVRHSQAYAETASSSESASILSTAVDSVTATESVALIITQSITTETFTVTDTTTTLPVVADSVTFTDTSTLSSVVSDIGVVTESVNVVVNATESGAVNYIYNIFLSSTDAATGDVNSEIDLVSPVERTDSSTFTESLTLSIQANDTINFTELTLVISVSMVTADSGAVSESLALSPVVTDAITLAETAAQYQASSDSLTLGETVSITSSFVFEQPGFFTESVVLWLLLTDSLTVSESSQLGLGLSDSLVVAESIGTYGPTGLDTPVTTESALLGQGCSESVLFEDRASIVVSQVTSDSSSLTESATNVNVIVVDLDTVSDSQTGTNSSTSLDTVALDEFTRISSQYEDSSTLSESAVAGSLTSDTASSGESAVVIVLAKDEVFENDTVSAFVVAWIVSDSFRGHDDQPFGHSLVDSVSFVEGVILVHVLSENLTFTDTGLTNLSLSDGVLEEDLLTASTSSLVTADSITETESGLALLTLTDEATLNEGFVLGVLVVPQDTFTTTYAVSSSVAVTKTDSGEALETKVRTISYGNLVNIGLTGSVNTAVSLTGSV